MSQLEPLVWNWDRAFSTEVGVVHAWEMICEGRNDRKQAHHTNFLTSLLDLFRAQEMMINYHHHCLLLHPNSLFGYKGIGKNSKHNYIGLTYASSAEVSWTMKTSDLQFTRPCPCPCPHSCLLPTPGGSYFQSAMLQQDSPHLNIIYPGKAKSPPHIRISTLSSWEWGLAYLSLGLPSSHFEQHHSESPNWQ